MGEVLPFQVVSVVLYEEYAHYLLSPDLQPCFSHQMDAGNLRDIDHYCMVNPLSSSPMGVYRARHCFSACVYPANLDGVAGFQF